MIGVDLIKLLSGGNGGYEFDSYEDFDEYHIQSKFYNINDKLVEDSFTSQFLKNEHDRFELILTIGDFDSIIVTSNNYDYSTFQESLNKDIEFKEEEDAIFFKYTIFKNKSASIIKLYCINTFEKYLSSLELEQLLGTFMSHKNKNGAIIFDIVNENEEINIQSSTILFTNQGNTEDFKSDYEYLQIIRGKRSGVCHFENSALYTFLPNEFNLQSSKNELSGIEKIILKLKIIFSLVSIFDISRIEKNKISLTLKAYKSLKFEWDYKSVSINSHSEWFKIYDWIYSSGGIVDKIGLARNIISLYLDIEQNAVLSNGVYYSIISGYEVYLKDNVKQYIELKGKISDNLIDLSNKANSIVDSFASNFKRSILTFVSFFASLLILRVLSEDSPRLGISWEASILSYAFLLIVCIYLIFSLWEIYINKQRFIANYSSLKERYSDLLIEDDINRILNNDKVFDEDIEFIEKKRNAYAFIWILMIVVFFVAIKVLST